MGSGCRVNRERDDRENDLSDTEHPTERQKGLAAPYPERNQHEVAKIIVRETVDARVATVETHPVCEVPERKVVQLNESYGGTITKWGWKELQT